MSGAASPPSEDSPLGGGCLCGAVRFELTEPLTTAGYCHCTHCQRRGGAAASPNGRLPRYGFRIVSGAEHVRSYQPDEGKAKAFCENCGSGLFSGNLSSDAEIGVRLGALDADPGIRFEFRQYLRSAADWEPVPDDGLTRHDGPRPS